MSSTAARATSENPLKRSGLSGLLGMTLAVTTAAAATPALAMTMAVSLTVSVTVALAATTAATVAAFSPTLSGGNVSQAQEVAGLAAGNDAVERSRSSVSHESPSLSLTGGDMPGDGATPWSRRAADDRSQRASGAACIQDEHRTALTANQG